MLRSPLLAALSISTLATSPALAQEVRVTCTATVSTVGNGGVVAPPFVNVAVGDSVTLTFDVQRANQLPFGRALGLLNWPTARLDVGTASDGLAFVPELQQVNLGDDAVQYGDFVGVNGPLASDASTQMQLFLSDPSGQAWASDQWEDLIGTTVSTTGLFSVFQMWSQPGGFVNFDLTAIRFEAAPGGLLGSPYCSAAPNSTGAVGLVEAYGLDSPGANDLTLVASDLPRQSVGFFIVSANQGFVANPGGSEGNLCLSGAIGRYVGPGQVKFTDFGGEIALALDLGAVPGPTGSVAVQAGQTWNFQLWHRDSGAAGSTSNFTRGLAVTFQ